MTIFWPYHPPVLTHKKSNIPSSIHQHQFAYRVNRSTEDLGLYIHLCNWILDFLTNRPQTVSIDKHFSYPTILNIGAPQGCVLSPPLYLLQARLHTHPWLQDHYQACGWHHSDRFDLKKQRDVGNLEKMWINLESISINNGGSPEFQIPLSPHQPWPLMVYQHNSDDQERSLEASLPEEPEESSTPTTAVLLQMHRWVNTYCITA